MLKPIAIEDILWCLKIPRIRMELCMAFPTAQVHLFTSPPQTAKAPGQRDTFACRVCWIVKM